MTFLTDNLTSPKILTNSFLFMRNIFFSPSCHLRRFFFAESGVSLRDIFFASCVCFSVVFQCQFASTANCLLLRFAFYCVLFFCCKFSVVAIRFSLRIVFLFWVFSGIISLVINCIIFIVASCFLLRVVFHFDLYSDHYEAKLGILCIASGFRKQPKSNLLWNPQHCYFSLIFFAVLDSKNYYLKYCTAQNFSKNRRICGFCNRVCGIYNRSQLLT